MRTPIPKEIGKPATRALENAQYTYLEQLEKVDEKDLKLLHGIGPKALRILKEKLHELKK